MYPILNIGPAVVPTAPLLLIIGMYVSLSVVERVARRLRLNGNATYECAANSLIVGFVVARLSFVLSNLSLFQEEPLGIIWPLTTGYNLTAGVIGGLIALPLLMQRKQLPFRPTLLALLPAALTLLFFISLGDLVARPGVGTVTTAAWGIERVGLRRHPTELYEMALAIGALFLWWRMAWTEPARAFWLTVGGYSFGRFFLDAFRITTPTLSSGHHIVQLALLPLVLLCLYQISAELPQESPA